MGKKGDQDINASQNKTLNESNVNGVDVFLFEVFESNQYIYRGQVKLSETPYQEKQKDEDGLLINVWIFPVKVTDNHKVIIEKKAKESQSTKTSVRETISQTYKRNPYIAEYAKRRANGVCQLCGISAPFKNKLGEPYLETHHIEWLSKGGSDTIDNTVALCPNCHKKIHILDSLEDKRVLKERNRY